MASEKQILANRKNALSSTGPQTETGKMAVRMNAIRHGLRAQDALLPDEDPLLPDEDPLLPDEDPLLPDEDPHQLQALCDQMRIELKPAGLLQEHLVERMTLAMWRLKRIERVEAGVFCFNFHDVLRERAVADGLGKEDLGKRGVRVGGANYRVAPTPEQKQLALGQEEKAENVTRSDQATLGQAFMRGARGSAQGSDVFSKLTRYEAGLERTLFKSLQELQRLQKLSREVNETPQLAR